MLDTLIFRTQMTGSRFYALHDTSPCLRETSGRSFSSRQLIRSTPDMNTPLPKVLIFCIAAVLACSNPATGASTDASSTNDKKPQAPNSVQGIIDNAANEDLALLRGKFIEKLGRNEYIFSDNDTEIKAIFGAAIKTGCTHSKLRDAKPNLNYEYLVWSEISRENHFFGPDTVVLKVCSYYDEKAGEKKKEKEKDKEKNKPASKAANPGRNNPGIPFGMIP